MTGQWIVAAVLLISGALGAPSANAQQTQGRAFSGTRQMRCVVKVAADVGVLPLSFDLVESLLRSDGVAGQAARRAWGNVHGALDACFDIRPLEDECLQEEAVSGMPPAAGTRMVVFALQVHLPDGVPGDAGEFGDALVEHFRNELQEAYAPYGEELKRQLDDAQTRRDVARRELEDLLKKSPPPQSRKSS
jgi:hypothetical protein